MKVKYFIACLIFINSYYCFGQWTEGSNYLITTKKVGIGTTIEPWATQVIYNPNFANLNVHTEPTAATGSLVQVTNDHHLVREFTFAMISPNVNLNWMGSPIQKSAILTASGSDMSSLIFGTRSSSPIIIGTSDIERIRVTADGKIGIGTDNPLSKLSVNGNIRATKVKVLADVNVPDYVFEPNYDLRTLKETKDYISKNKHLPEIPPASEINKNGIDLGDMNMKLLKKIEELTLYQIELLERLEKAEKKIQQLENK